MKNPKPKSITRRTREPPAVRDPSHPRKPHRPHRRVRRASRDHPIVERGFDTPARKSVASVQSTGGSARAPVVGRRSSDPSERCVGYPSIHPSIHRTVSHPKRRIVIRQIETWVIRFRPLARYTDRSDEEPSGTTCDGRRDGRTRRVATERSETKFTHSTRTRCDARLASSTDRRVASRVAHPRPSPASRTRAARSNLEQQEKKINSVPFRSHP